MYSVFVVVGLVEEREHSGAFGVAVVERYKFTGLGSPTGSGAGGAEVLVVVVVVVVVGGGGGGRRGR